MASQVYNDFKRASAAAEIDLDAGGDDIRIKLVMGLTTVDTENDGIVNLADFTTIDEMDGANYAVKALANELVRVDDANDRAEFDADPVTYTALGNGTSDVVGVLLYKHVATDADHVAIAFIEFAVPQSPGGSDFVITWNAEGILNLS